jgi:hypothetical protein
VGYVGEVRGKWVPFASALACSLACAAACSSFEGGDAAPSAGDDGSPGVDAASPPVDAAAGPDANPCPFGNGRFDGGFCDDFDRSSSLSTIWLAPSYPDGGDIEIVPSDAAASPPNVLHALLPPHATTIDGAFAFAPVGGARKLDCRFLVNVIDVPNGEVLSLFNVRFDDVAPAARVVGLFLDGTRFAALGESYALDGGDEGDGSITNTPVKLDPGWRQVHLAIQKGQPLTVQIDSLYTYTGPVPSDVAVSIFFMGVGSANDGGGGGEVAYDDVVCTVE